MYKTSEISRTYVLNANYAIILFKKDFFQKYIFPG